MSSHKKSSKKSAAGRRGKTRRPQPANGGTGVRVAIAVLILGGFLLASLLFLAHLRDRYRPTPPQPNLTQLLEDVRVELESAVLRSGVSLGEIQVHKRGETTELSLTADYPEPTAIAELRRRLARISTGIELRADAGRHSLSVMLAGRPRYRLVFKPEQPASVPVYGARVAIIMDDIGRDLQTVRSLLDIDLPVTLSILPNTRHAAEAATLAHRYRREVMIHIPMEPLGYPGTNPGEGALLVRLSRDEIRRRFLGYLEKIPYAVGGNNHMGSRFTANAEKMRPVLEIMRGEGLFFIDSRTTGKSVAAAEARTVGVPVATRDLFLDNQQDVEAIAAQIRKLVSLAARKGSAIGICHPHPQTLEALRREAGYLHEQGVQVVAASNLVPN